MRCTANNRLKLTVGNKTLFCGVCLFDTQGAQLTLDGGIQPVATRVKCSQVCLSVEWCCAAGLAVGFIWGGTATMLLMIVVGTTYFVCGL